MKKYPAKLTHKNWAVYWEEVIATAVGLSPLGNRLAKKGFAILSSNGSAPKGRDYERGLAFFDSKRSALEPLVHYSCLLAMKESIPSTLSTPPKA